MKTVLIVAGIIVFLVYGFVLYCCIKVGKESDEQYNKLREGKEQEDDRSRVCNVISLRTVRIVTFLAPGERNAKGKNVFIVFLLHHFAGR